MAEFALINFVTYSCPMHIASWLMIHQKTDTVNWKYH